MNVLWIGYFVSEMDEWEHPYQPSRDGAHMTVCYRPTEEQISAFQQLEHNKKLHLIGYGDNGENAGFLVDYTGFTTAKHPHITMGHHGSPVATDQVVFDQNCDIYVDAVLYGVTKDGQKIPMGSQMR